MRRVVMIQTIDGELHPSLAEAKRHAEAKYADGLMWVTHELIKHGKFSEMPDWIDANLDKLVRLSELKADLVLQGQEESCER